jgi:hypothetical protein
MGKLQSEGRIAEADDIAAEGTVITHQHIVNYREACRAVARATGTPVPHWSDEDAE